MKPAGYNRYQVPDAAQHSWRSKARSTRSRSTGVLAANGYVCWRSTIAAARAVERLAESHSRRRGNLEVVDLLGRSMSRKTGDADPNRLGSAAELGRIHQLHDCHRHAVQGGRQRRRQCDAAFLRRRSVIFSWTTRSGRRGEPRAMAEDVYPSCTPTNQDATLFSAARKTSTADHGSEQCIRR